MPAAPIPTAIIDALQLADPSWRPVLHAGLDAVEQSTPGYLAHLAAAHYLPTKQRLFAAFALPLPAVRYVLVGEGPYPRADSATGVCFMDGAVGSLWCENGLSKPVNRATSLRNFMKMLLVADGKLLAADTGAAALAHVATKARGDGLIQTLAELQHNLMRQGFLLLNAALVFRPHVPPLQEARAWLPFLQTVLAALGALPAPPILILWGKVAEQLKRLPETDRFPQVSSEHPFNLTFIHHPGMLELFGPLKLLQA